MSLAENTMTKRLRPIIQPLEAVGAALLATVSFAVPYLCMSFKLREASFAAAIIFGPVLFGILTLAVTASAVMLMLRKGPWRGATILTMGMWAGVITGSVLGDRNYYALSGKFYALDEMASYVNISPDLDKGSSYMDAGHIYFADHSYIKKEAGLMFKNGASYCIAPIVRDANVISADKSDPGALQVQPIKDMKSGTFDFWAVGKDCCKANGAGFSCGDANSHLARAGERVVDEHDRAMYLLATQEWSATMQRTVGHPLFFTWTKDPIASTTGHINTAWSKFWMMTLIFFVASIGGSFAMSMTLTQVFKAW